MPYGTSGSASNGCSDHSAEGVLADYPTKAKLSGYSAEGVGAQDTAEGGFRYGERLGNVAFEATAVFSFSEKGSQWEAAQGEASVPTAGGKATMVQSSVPATGGKAAPRVPRVSVRPVFSHPPLPKEKQVKLEQARASFTQRVSEARAKRQVESGRSEEEIGRDARDTGSGYNPRTTTRIRRTRAAYASSLWNVGNSSSSCEGQAPKFGAFSKGACCVGCGRSWFAGYGEPHGVRVFEYHRVVALPGACSGDYRRDQPATGEFSQIKAGARGKRYYGVLWFRGRMGARFLQLV